MEAKKQGIIPIVILTLIAGTGIVLLGGYQYLTTKLKQPDNKDRLPAREASQEFSLPNNSPAPTISVDPTLKPLTTVKPSPFKTAPTAKMPTATATPTPPKVTATNTPVPTPTTAVDSNPPTLTIQGGPSDGSTVDFNNFCFPLYVSDNVSKYPKVFVRYRFDADSFGSWTTDVSPCYNNVLNGQHIFAVQAQDEAGNLSSEQRRTFTVSISGS